MYYNVYHVTDFMRNRMYLHLECNKFVLVLVQVELIHFDCSKCIRLFSTKTNTNLLHSNSIHSIKEINA